MIRDELRPHIERVKQFMLKHGTNIRVLQELLGHTDVKTTEIYTHLMRKDISDLQNPLDRLYDMKNSGHERLR